MSNNIQEDEDIMSVHQLWKNKNIYWIGTYKTILKYISNDYKNIFNPIITGGRTGKRYFVKKKNVDEFIRKFENNELI
jgi:hypothetical protein